jgi:hypothetical protein
MKLVLAIVALISSTIAAPAPETDALAKEGLERLWLDVAKYPDSYSKNCTSRTIARRREWYDHIDNGKAISNALQVKIEAFGEVELH